MTLGQAAGPARSGAAGACQPYPVKPQAEEALKKLKSDPRVTGTTQLELGRMICSEVFKKLDAKGQIQALKLFEANLDHTSGPSRVRDAVESLRTLKSEQAARNVLTGLTKASPLKAHTVDMTKSLVLSQEFGNLSQADQLLVTAGLKKAKCNPKYVKNLKRLLTDPRFKALTPQERTAIWKQTKELPASATVRLFQANLGDKDALSRAHQVCGSLGNVKSREGKLQVLDGLTQRSPLTYQWGVDKTKELLGSPAFAGLSESDQKLVTEGLREAKAEPQYAKNLKKLLEDPKFQALTPREQTAVLSQTRNYPDRRSVHNIQRMLQKGWFTSQSLADKRRSLKTVAFLSKYDAGDRTIINNTLDKLLDPHSAFKLKWEPMTSAAKSDPDTQTIYLNRNRIKNDDGRVSSKKATQHMVRSAVAHEVSHVLNRDKVAASFQYFEAEYRAWYVGFKARYDREPSNREIMEQRIRWQFSPRSSYGRHAANAMKDPAEAQKFYDFLSKVTGLPVDASNWNTVLHSAPSTWTSDPNASAPVPGGNLDNH
jgi:hypothetical protein